MALARTSDFEIGKFGKNQILGQFGQVPSENQAPVVIASVMRLAASMAPAGVNRTCREEPEQQGGLRCRCYSQFLRTRPDGLPPCGSSTSWIPRRTSPMTRLAN